MKFFRFSLASLLLVLASWVSPAGAASLAKEPSATQSAYMAAFEQYLVRTYIGADLARTGLSPQVFRSALVGYFNLKRQGLAAREVLTVVDFSRSSRLNRLWVIDMANTRLLYHTLVAHGKNSGVEFARTFSNREGSEMSSLGFYLTGETYQGKHGLSLRLRGMDAGYNSKAAERAVVVHGADYVSRDFVQRHGRLGRSQGCPALPSALSAPIIKTIKSGSVLYIQGPTNTNYASSWLNLDAALPAFARSQGISPMQGQAGQ